MVTSLIVPIGRYHIFFKFRCKLEKFVSKVQCIFFNLNLTKVFDVVGIPILTITLFFFMAINKVTIMSITTENQKRKISLGRVMAIH